MQQFLQFIILTIIYSSTCFGRPHAYHQELNNCSSGLWFFLRSVVIAVLLVVVGPAGRLSQPQGHSAAGRIMSMKNSSDTIGNPTRDLPACSAVPQPTAPPGAPRQ